VTKLGSCIYGDHHCYRAMYSARTHALLE